MSNPVIVVFSLLLFYLNLNVVFCTESCLHEAIRSKSEKSDLVLRVNATSSEFGKNASTVFDGSKQTCFSTQSTLQGVKKHEIEIQLKRKVEILKIIIHLEPYIMYNFTVLVENHLGPTLCYNVSTGKTGVVEFSCVNVNFNASILKYDKIRIADNFHSGKFTVCEVDIVVNKKSFCCAERSMPPNVIAVKKQTDDHPLVYEMRCDKNFILEGASVIHCNKEGIWDHELPVCRMDVKMVNDYPPVEKTLECDANAVAIDAKSGRVSFTKNSTIVGSKAILHCADGYRPKGKDESECSPNGWSHIGNFEFACTFVECGNTYNIKNGFVQLLKPSKSFDRIHVGSVISVHCNNDHHMFNKGVILRYCGISGVWVKSEQQGDKSAVSDLETICASSNSTIWKAYVFVAVITFGICLIITTIVVISIILCRRSRRIDRHYQHHSPPSTVHSLAESSHLGYRYQQPENDYNSIVYEDTYHLNNFNNAGNIIDNVRSGNRMYYEYDLRSSKADHAENIYSEPLDAKVKNTENVIYS